MTKKNNNLFIREILVVTSAYAGPYTQSEVSSSGRGVCYIFLAGNLRCIFIVEFKNLFTFMRLCLAFCSVTLLVTVRK